MLARGQERLAPARESLPLLTRAEQVRQLSAGQAERAYPVRLRGVVTYFDSESPDLFVQDSTAGIWVDLGGAKVSFRSGQLVEVEGVSSAPDFAPQVSRPRVRILGEAPLPVPRPVTFDRMTSGGEDSQWVQLEGIAHSATEREGIVVPAISLDDWVLQHTEGIGARVDVIKIDVEGAELEVFAGMQRLLASPSAPTAILFESSTAGECADMLRSFGYRVMATYYSLGRGLNFIGIDDERTISRLMTGFRGQPTLDYLALNQVSSADSFDSLAEQSRQRLSWPWRVLRAWT